ncbi:MAG: uroporphyrinogen-III decarboxylase [Firmicutes bacterium]|nr:uroporphyrinogen-III decarboxylase [Bacillota bacterium]
MTVGEELYNQRLQRIKTAMDMGKPDRIPISLGGPSFIRYSEPEATLSDYVLRPEWADDAVIRSYAMLPEIDTAPALSGNKRTSGAMWFAKTKLPGIELPNDALWQYDEVGMMTADDYDTIINKGWGTFSKELLTRLGYSEEDLKPDFEYMKKMQKRVKEELGLVNMSGAAYIMPFEILSAARSLTKFLRDMYRMPDKVIAAMDVIADEYIASAQEHIREHKPLSVFSGNGRGGCQFLSMKKFEKFVWPYIKKTTDAFIAEGTKVLFHNDAKWDENLSYWRDFPKASCIFDPDSLTDIVKIKEVLGDYMCVTGDVPPALLELGTPEENYKYARGLIDLFGHSGFIMSSGCSVPPHAPLENIKAVIAATIEG